MAWAEEEVADIVQEAVMTAWREFGRFQRDTNFKAWMFRILINTSFRLNKRLARRQAASLDESAMELEASMEREDAWASLLESPARLRELLDARLAAAIDDLSETERECLLLRVLEQFSYKEIAAMLDMPMGTVMSHVHRGRMRLRERLAGMAVEFRLMEETVE